MSERSSIGEKRLEYLDYANKSIASGDYGAAERNLNSFLATIREDSAVSNYIKKAFDGLETEKNENFLKMIKQTEGLEMWTQTEERARLRDYYIAKNIADRVTACWNIAMTNGAFND